MTASFLFCAGATHDAVASFRVMYPRRKRKETPKFQRVPQLQVADWVYALVSTRRAEDDGVGSGNPQIPEYNAKAA